MTTELTAQTETETRSVEASPPRGFTVRVNPKLETLEVCGPDDRRVARLTYESAGVSGLSHKEIAGIFSACAKETGHTDPRQQACLRNAVTKKVPALELK